jgi:hypothetical protein
LKFLIWVLLAHWARAKRDLGEDSSQKLTFHTLVTILGRCSKLLQKGHAADTEALATRGYRPTIQLDLWIR